MRRTSLEDPRLYINRHLSWLQFNRRVLEEANDPSNPLLERVKFLAITANNLDEFVEVRVAGLLQQAEQSRGEIGPDGLTPAELLTRLAAELQAFVKDQYACWREDLVPGLSREAIRVRKIEELSADAKKVVEKFYREQVEPILTPVTVDPAHPFPRVLNKALCVAFLLRRRRKSADVYLGVVTVPRALPRLLRLPADEGAIEFAFLHDIVHAYSQSLYHGYEVLSAAPFRVTRNSNRTCVRRSRAASSIPWTPSCTCAARAPRCAWKSRRAPILKSSSACVRTLPWRHGRCSKYKARSICRGCSTSTIRLRGRT